MNNDKTLINNFANKSKYPIWYYKQLESINIDDVIFNLLKDTFVVELNNKKIVIIFGKNRKHEIGCSQSCDRGLDYTSYETINRAFKEGVWYKVTDLDTTDEFKEQYKLEKEEYENEELRKRNIELITRVIRKDISEKDRNMFVEHLNTLSVEELEEILNNFFNN